MCSVGCIVRLYNLWLIKLFIFTEYRVMLKSNLTWKCLNQVSHVFGQALKSETITMVIQGNSFSFSIWRVIFPLHLRIALFIFFFCVYIFFIFLIFESKFTKYSDRYFYLRFFLASIVFFILFFVCRWCTKWTLLLRVNLEWLACKNLMICLKDLFFSQKFSLIFVLGASVYLYCSSTL